MLSVLILRDLMIANASSASQATERPVMASSSCTIYEVKNNHNHFEQLSVFVADPLFTLSNQTEAINTNLILVARN